MPQGVPTFAKFTRKKKAAYLQLLREGNHRGTSARAVGVDPSLVRRYQAVHPEFADLEEQAEMEAHGKIENALYQAALKGNVVACQVWLYNRCPERWADKRQLDHTGHVRQESILRIVAEVVDNNPVRALPGPNGQENQNGERPVPPGAA